MPHKLDNASLLRLMAQRLEPYIEITGEPYIDGKHRKVATRCTRCDRVMHKVETNVLRGKGLGCRCSAHTKWTPTQRRLAERYYAAKNRCTPGTMYAERYGDRGIEMRFEDVNHYVTWIMEHLPHPDYLGVEIDRVDNNGHYEPGNLRLTDRRLNNANKGATRFVLYTGLRVARLHAAHLMKHDHPELPFSIRWVEKLLARGNTPDEILAMSHSGQGRKPTTSQTPDPDIVSRYRDA